MRKRVIIFTFVSLSVSQSFIQTVDLEDGSPSTYVKQFKISVLDYISPFTLLLFKVLRLFLRKSKLSLDDAIAA